jgi:hypothetical protein
MNKAIERLKNPRMMLIKILNELSTEQLNKVPAGFNNNVIWNVAHMIAAQQGLCYKRAGEQMKIEEEFFQAYKPDTKPEKFVDSEEVEKIKELLLSTLDELETDYQNKLFGNYPTFTTRYGVEIDGIDEVLSFLPFHDGLHIGSVLALRKLV